MIDIIINVLLAACAYWAVVDALSDLERKS